MQTECFLQLALELQAARPHLDNPWALRLAAAEAFLERQAMLLLQVPPSQENAELLHHVLQQFVQPKGDLQGGPGCAPSAILLR